MRRGLVSSKLTEVSTALLAGESSLQMPFYSSTLTTVLISQNSSYLLILSQTYASRCTNNAVHKIGEVLACRLYLIGQVILPGHKFRQVLTPLLKSLHFLLSQRQMKSPNSDWLTGEYNSFPPSQNRLQEYHKKNQSMVLDQMPLNALLRTGELNSRTFVVDQTRIRVSTWRG